MNALIGSSMGALISTYGVCEYPESFSKAGSVSPAYWFSLSDLTNYISTEVSGLQNHRVYFVAGQNESSGMVPDLNTIKNSLQAKGLAASNTFTKIDQNGTHTESYWKTQFGALYEWLFANETLSANQYAAVNPKIIQTVSGKIFVEGLPNQTAFELYNVAGAKVDRMVLSNGTFELSRKLATGIYILKSVETASRPIKVIKK